MGYYGTTSRRRSGCTPETANPRSARAVSGRRFYSASLERWVSRDPIGEGGGVNYYNFAKNDAISRFDADGRVSIITLTKDEKKCGGWKVLLRWMLDNPTPITDGFFVQKVTREYRIRQCDGTQEFRPTEVFWESWPAVSPLLLSAIDAARGGEWPFRKGTQMVRGELKYFSQRTTGLLYYGWQTSQQPEWWGLTGDDGERSAQRVISSSWDCCCEEYSHVTVEVSP